MSNTNQDCCWLTMRGRCWMRTLEIELVLVWCAARHHLHSELLRTDQIDHRVARAGPTARHCLQETVMAQTKELWTAFATHRGRRSGETGQIYVAMHAIYHEVRVFQVIPAELWEQTMTLSVDWTADADPRLSGPPNRCQPVASRLMHSIEWYHCHCAVTCPLGGSSQGNWPFSVQFGCDVCADVSIISLNSNFQTQVLATTGTHGDSKHLRQTSFNT